MKFLMKASTSAFGEKSFVDKLNQLETAFEIGDDIDVVVTKNGESILSSTTRESSS